MNLSFESAAFRGKMSVTDRDFVDVVLEGNKKIIHKHLVIKKDKCCKVADVLCQLGGIYEFHPVIKSVDIARCIYEGYKSRLIDQSGPENQLVYFLDEFKSNNDKHKMMVSIAKDKGNRLTRPCMVCKAIIYIKVGEGNEKDVAFVRVYQLPCKLKCLIKWQQLFSFLHQK